MPEPTVLIVAVNAERVQLQQTISVLRSHGIEYVVRESLRSALTSARAVTPLFVLVQGGEARLPLVTGVEQIATALGARVPLLVVANELTEAEEYRLFAAGARDVLSAPISPTRLRMRVLSMRRGALGEKQSATRIICGDLVIHPGRREAWIGDTEISLTRSEFDLLLALARDPRRVLTRDELVRSIGRGSNSKTVESHLSRLRRKISDQVGFRVIEPVRGVGYRLGTITLSRQVS
ncbi:MAG: response regulator transcription factor [Ornithinimicrobium sp.]